MRARVRARACVRVRACARACVCLSLALCSGWVAWFCTFVSRRVQQILERLHGTLLGHGEETDFWAVGGGNDRGGVVPEGIKYATACQHVSMSACQHTMLEETPEGTANRAGGSVFEHNNVRSNEGQRHVRLSRTQQPLPCMTSA